MSFFLFLNEFFVCFTSKHEVLFEEEAEEEGKQEERWEYCAGDRVIHGRNCLGPFY